MGIDPTNGFFTPEQARSELRRQMPIVERWAYFDHAAVAPLPLPTRTAIASWLDQSTLDGDTQWLRWAKQVESLRSDLARLVHAKSTEIALVPNTSTGISMVAEGLAWREGDNVVFPKNEFPSNAIAWNHLARKGVEPRSVPLQAHSNAVHSQGDHWLDDIVGSMDQRTRLVSVSWVGFLSGYRCRLAELCDEVHRRGALLFVDAIQGMGAFPLDLSDIPIDFLAADGHKWMLGPEGAGMLFIRESRMDLVEPLMVGWGSVSDSGKFTQSTTNWKTDASRFEPGSQNMVGMIGFGKSVELLLSLGSDRKDSPIADAILENVSYLAQGLDRIRLRHQVHDDEACRSGIVSWEMPSNDPNFVRQRLLERKIVTSVRLGQLRASLHAYHNRDELDRLLDAIEETAKG